MSRFRTFCQKLYFEYLELKYYLDAKRYGELYPSDDPVGSPKALAGDMVWELIAKAMSSKHKRAAAYTILSHADVPAFLAQFDAQRNMYQELNPHFSQNTVSLQSYCVRSEDDTEVWLEAIAHKVQQPHEYSFTDYHVPPQGLPNPETGPDRL